jgi:hypothetical protein
MKKLIFAFCGAALLSAVAVPVSVVAITAVSNQASARPCKFAIGSGKTFCLQKWQTRKRFGEVGRYRQARRWSVRSINLDSIFGVEVFFYIITTSVETPGQIDAGERLDNLWNWIEDINHALVDTRLAREFANDAGLHRLSWRGIFWAFLVGPQCSHYLEREFSPLLRARSEAYWWSAAWKQIHEMADDIASSVSGTLRILIREAYARKQNQRKELTI